MTLDDFFLWSSARWLTVVSYNIHRARGLDNRVDVGRIPDVLRQTGADVVGLQEVFASRP